MTIKNKFNAQNRKLHDALLYRDTEQLKILIAAGAELNVQDEEGYTPLARAVLHHRKDAAELLIDAGANVNLANRLGSTPLIICCSSGIDKSISIKIARKLITAGADLDAQNKNGMTAVMEASFSNHFLMVELLYQNNVNINLKNQTGFSAMTIAERRGYKNIQDFLKEKHLEQVTTGAKTRRAISIKKRPPKIKREA